MIWYILKIRIKFQVTHLSQSLVVLLTFHAAEKLPQLKNFLKVFSSLAGGNEI